MEFKEIKTQEEFDAAIAERIKREKETAASKYKDYDSLKEENTSLKNQLGEANKALEKNKVDSEGFNKQIEELTGKISGYELKNLKTTIALQNGVPFDLADRLNGTDEASILEDAKRLAAFVGQTAPTQPLKSTEPQTTGGNEDSAYKNLVQNLNLED